MKRKTSKSAAICFALLLVILWGCADATQNSDNDAPPTSTGDNTQPPTSAVTPDDVPHTTPDIPMVPDEPIDSLPDKDGSILSNLQIRGQNTNLFNTAHSELTNINELYRLGHNLLAISGGYDFEVKSVYAKLSLISIETGKIVAQQNMMGVAEYHLQVCGNKAVFHDETNGRITVFDSTLTSITDYKYSAKQVYFDTKCEKAYTFTDNGIIITNLAISMDKREYRQYRDIRIVEDNGYFVTIAYIDTSDMMEHYGVFDLDSGEIKVIDTEHPAQKIESNGNYAVALLTGENGVNMIINAEGKRVYSSNGFTQTLLVGDKIFEASYNAEGDPKVCIYAETGEFLSSCIVTHAEWMGLQYDPVWYPEYNGYFYAINDIDGSSKILFWDMSEAINGEDLKLEDPSSLEQTDATALPKKYYERARIMGEKYGLTILIADQCIGEVGNYKIGKRGHNEKAVTSALDGLEKALESFPEGFFKRLLFGQNYEIEIQLFSGQITHKETGSSFAGFVYEDAGKLVMGLDARDAEIVTHIMEQTVYHEVSHMIDKRLEFGSKYRENALYSEEGWLSHNPEHFEYTGDGDAVSGALKGYEKYLIDDYACTDSGEDRARVFEYAMMAALYPVEKYTKYFDPSVEGLRAKLEYYSLCIRDELGKDWNSIPLWEKIG